MPKKLTYNEFKEWFYEKYKNYEIITTKEEWDNDYKNYNFKINLKCKKCNDFFTKKVRYIRKTKNLCECVSNNKKLTYNEFKEWFYEKYKNYEIITTKEEWDNDYKNYNFKLNLKCKKCKNVFVKKVRFIKKTNNLICLCSLKNKKLTYNELQRRMNLKREKNNFLNYNELTEEWFNKNYKNRNTKIKICCEKHGFFTTTIHSHFILDSNCPACAKEINQKKNKLTYEEFIAKIHKNYEIITTKEEWDLNYKNSRKSYVKIKCKKHSLIINKKVERILESKTPCPKCSGELVNKERKITYNQLMDASKKNKNKLRISKEWFNKNYKNRNTKIKLECRVHGIFWQSVSSYMKNIRCKKCFDDKSRNSEHDWRIKLKEKFNLNDDDIIFDKKYFEKYHIPQKIKVNLRCKIHGFSERSIFPLLWQDSPICLKCEIEKKGSKGERKIIEYLINHNIEFVPQKLINYNNKRFYFDFFIPSKNILIEFDGQQHFINNGFFGSDKTLKEQKKSDFIKNKIAFIKHYFLIRIPFFEYKNIEKILNKWLI